METGAQQTRRSLCIGLLAHVDAGKTSITEQLLYRSGAIRSPARMQKSDRHSPIAFLLDYRARSTLPLRRQRVHTYIR